MGALALRGPGQRSNSVYYQRVTWNQQSGICEEVWGLHWHDGNLFEKELVILVNHKLKVSEKNATDARETSWN